MKAVLTHIIFLVLLITCTTSMAGDTTMPTVVEVKAYGDSKEKAPIGVSAGFVFEREGFILSTYQALLDQTSQNLLTRIEVYIPEFDKHFAAEVVGVEPTLDLSILKIFPDIPLRAGELIAYEELEEGVEIRALTPVSMTKANHSHSSQQFGVLNVLPLRECYQEDMTSTMLQGSFDPSASMVPGMPILDQESKVIGMYTGYKPSPHDLANGGWDANHTYILPAYLAMNIYDSLKHKSSMKSPWTGFSVRRLTEKERKIFPNDRGEKGGIAIESVWKGSPAEKLGIKPEDILVRFGHYRIESPADFQKWLYMYGVGMTVKLTLIRNGNEYLVREYTIEKRPAWAIPK